jgi:hypothetical protein
VNPEVKEKWLSALRSGEFAQGKNLLHKVDSETKEEKFCCLGVLCAIAVKDEVIEAPELRGAPEVPHYEYAHSTAFLPREVREWSGIESDNGEYQENYADGSYLLKSLVLLNDDGVPFSVIADVIEREF